MHLKGAEGPVNANRRKHPMVLEKYSFGIGDRFGMEGAAQIRALLKARTRGIDVVPVWNKSHREHGIIGSSPGDTRHEAEDAIRATGWTSSYYVDADHIGLSTVDAFVDSSDFFTIDVADFIGRPADAGAKQAFHAAMKARAQRIELTEVGSHIAFTDESLVRFGDQYLLAIQEAGRVYRAIAERKGRQNFVAEVSLDEAETSQSPEELFLILAAAAQEGVQLQTIAPKFAGKFLKGIDYVGNVAEFERQFELDLAVIKEARKLFDLPPSLKISVHSGSDKFSLYPSIRRSLVKSGSGVHVKTAGTTWLEELIGLIEGGEDGLAFAKDVYRESLLRYDALIRPYLSVVEIQPARLPAASTVEQWGSTQFASALRHDASCRDFNPDMRQLLHVGYRIAAEKLGPFKSLLTAYRSIVEENVTANLLHRHLIPIFGGEPAETPGVIHG
jgi:hypothetical protein